ncbi:MAG: hypothetical protein R3B09_23955 [Nannocystaceae bacterium]
MNEAAPAGPADPSPSTRPRASTRAPREPALDPSAPPDRALVDASGPAGLRSDPSAPGEPSLAAASPRSDTSAPAAPPLLAEATPRPDAGAPADPPFASPATAGLVSGASPVRRLLGLSVRRVARTLGREGEVGEGGWRHYGESVAIRFEAGRSVAVMVRVPSGLACEEAAKWAGFTAASAPLRRASTCNWPGISERHRLARGIVGELELATAVFHVWLP